MSAILEGTPDKKLALVTGRAYPEQAQETAKYLGTDVLETCLLYTSDAADE